MTLTVGKPETVGLSAERLGRLDRWGAQLVEGGKLAGLLTVIARRGQVAYHACHGMADIAREVPMHSDSVFRIYSMTKPLTSLAVMMLYEEGRFQLDDPITRFLPEFRNMRVFAGGSAQRPVTVPAVRDISFHDLLTHTSGLTYSFLEATPVDAMYRTAGLDALGSTPLAELSTRLAALPLLSQPGEAWNYSVSTDLLGHLVAVISGQSFDTFLRERVLAPLGMHDTGFVVTPEQLPRFTANYTKAPDGTLHVLDDPQASPFSQPDRMCSGGGGLVGTAPDYLRFCQMMLNGGMLEGTRLIGRKAVELMTTDHVGPARMAEGSARLSGTPQHGRGFGLGFAVTTDPAQARVLGSAGQYDWGGAASTAFFIDPVEDMAVIFMAQFMPPNADVVRELRVLAYQAIVD